MPRPERVGGHGGAVPQGRSVTFAATMNRTGTLLIVWNVALTALLGWLLLRERGTTPPESTAAQDPVETPTPNVDADSLRTPPEARIAYFFMDSVQQGYEKVRESGDRFRNESRRLEQNMQREMQRAQGRYEELMRKDHTYSTQAEVERDQAEVQQLMGSIQELQARSERELAALEVRMLSEISLEIEAFLEEYNEHAGFDYILSVQDGGQIWVGNDELDITSEVLNGLNSRHRNARSRKEGAASPAQP